MKEIIKVDSIEKNRNEEKSKENNPKRQGNKWVPNSVIVSLKE